MHLDLRGTQVTDAGLAQLAALSELQSLDLTLTQISDTGLEHLKRLKNLQRLDLSATPVTIAAVEDLKATLPGLEVTLSPVDPLQPRLREFAIAQAIEWLKSGDARMREEALDNLSLIRPAARAAAPALIELLKEPADDLLKARAAEMLGSIGTDDVEAVVTVLSELAQQAHANPSRAQERGPGVDPRSAPAAMAARSLGRLGARAQAAVPVLIDLLDDQAWTVRYEAVNALAEMGPAGRPAIESITAMIPNELDATVRQSAIEALKRIEQTVGRQ